MSGQLFSGTARAGGLAVPVPRDSGDGLSILASRDGSTRPAGHHLKPPKSNTHGSLSLEDGLLLCVMEQHLTQMTPQEGEPGRQSSKRSFHPF